MYKDNVSPSNTIGDISKKKSLEAILTFMNLVIFLFVFIISFLKFFPTQYIKNIYYILVIMKKWK